MLQVSACGESGVVGTGHRGRAAVFVFEEAGERAVAAARAPAVGDFVGPAHQWHVLSFSPPLCGASVHQSMGARSSDMVFFKKENL